MYCLFVGKVNFYQKIIKVQTKNSLKIDWRAKSSTGTVNAFMFKDGGFHVIYIPSLKLSSYGDTAEEATQMMNEVVLKDFLDTLFEAAESDAMDELRKLGWVQSSFFRKKFTSESYVDKNGILKDFNLEEDTEIHEATVNV